MNSYLKFLSRNKLYTAIETVGLAVSLAFVILIGNLPRQGFADEDIPLPDKVRQISFYQMILREHLEEVGIGLHSGNPGSSRFYY